MNDIDASALLKVEMDTDGQLSASAEDGDDQAKKLWFYTEEEDLEILAYLKINGLFGLRRGNSIWKQMEKEQVLPGRSWQSLRNRCNKVLIPTYFHPDELEAVEHDRKGKKYPNQVKSLRTAYPIPNGLVLISEESLEPPVPPRRDYSAEEDAILVKFVQENGLYEARKGINAWKQMERLNVLPNRTWQSMKNRCLRHLFPKMSDDDFKETKKDPASPCWNFKTNRAAVCYSIEEDNQIVRYIADNDRYNDVNRLQLWKEMAKHGTLGNRCAKSLSDRYRRILSQRIPTGCYDLTDEEVRKFPKP